MVSFQCDGCADTVKKPKLDQHRQKCWASFTCLDCSKTFANQDYKVHTSCISEAEKYQGALYKGNRKNDPKSIQSTPANTPPITPQDTPAPSSGPAMTIHPSRLTQLEHPSPASHSAYAPRGGRGGATAARGGGRGRFGQPLVSGENKFNPSGGMRSWGSPTVEASPVVEDQPSRATSSVVLEEGAPDKKKKKRKGDKGGTGAKANSKRPKSDGTGTTTTDENTKNDDVEPESKKRKRSSSPADEPVEQSEKTSKRIRKNAGKLGAKVGTSMNLDEWLKQVGQSKKEQITISDVTRAVKVVFEDGKWVLSI